MSNGENYLPSPVMCSLELPGEPFPVLYSFLSKLHETNEITLITPTLLYNPNTKEDCCQWTFIGSLQFLVCELHKHLTPECCINTTICPQEPDICSGEAVIISGVDFRWRPISRGWCRMTRVAQVYLFCRQQWTFQQCNALTKCTVIQNELSFQLQERCSHPLRVSLQ